VCSGHLPVHDVQLEKGVPTDYLPRYRRVFNLSKAADTEQVAAVFDHGVLKLRIPKAAHARPREMEIFEICVE